MGLLTPGLSATSDASTRRYTDSGKPTRSCWSDSWGFLAFDMLTFWMDELPGGRSLARARSHPAGFPRLRA